MPKGWPKLNRTNASQDVKKQDDLTKFLAELEKWIEESKWALWALKNDVNQSVVTKLWLPAQADNAMIQEYSKAFQTSIKSLKSWWEEVWMDIVKWVTVIHVDNSTNIDALELKIDPLLWFYEKEIEEWVVKLMNEQGEVKIMIALDKESNQLKQEPVIDKFTEALSKEWETLTSIDFEKTKENKNKFNFSDDIQKNNSLNSDMLVDQWNINKEAQQYIEEFMHKNWVLNTNLTAEQVYKIYEVHNMERKDWETDDTQLNIRKWIALKWFFNAEQIRVLMEGKVCGIFSDFSNSVKEKFSKKWNEQKETPANWQFKKFPKNKPVELPLKTSLKLWVKWAVLNIDASSNAVTVGEKEELSKESFYIEDINFLADEEELSKEVLVKVRYRHSGVRAKIEFLEEGSKKLAKVNFLNETAVISPGQAAVIYKAVEDDENDRRVLGGGRIIERSVNWTPLKKNH